MEGQKITHAVRNLFKGIDDRDWPLALSVLAEELFLDYSSMNSVEAAIHNHEQVFKAWDSFLTGFDRTQHTLTEFKVQLHGAQADVFYVGKADHFIGDDVWTTEGNYETKLEKQNGAWIITSHKISYDKQSGNTSLPRLAHQNLTKRKQQ
jgi:hypothetical protein